MDSLNTPNGFLLQVVVGLVAWSAQTYYLQQYHGVSIHELQIPRHAASSPKPRDGTDVVLAHFKTAFIVSMIYSVWCVALSTLISAHCIFILYLLLFVTLEKKWAG